jgi:glucose/arabinose dehydrogenase
MILLIRFFGSLLSLSLLLLVSLVLIFTVLSTGAISVTNKILYPSQNNDYHLVKALATKYHDVGIPFPGGPIIIDPHLMAKVVSGGLRYPTSMTFLGPNDFLVTEKDAGTVRRVMNGTVLKQPLLDVSVATYGHRGLLGIAVSPTFQPTTTSSSSYGSRNTTTSIFLYYTQAKTHTSDDITEGKIPAGNRLYKYKLVDNRLVNPQLLLDLPAIPGAIGNGGKVIVGPDDNVYLTIGDVGINGHNTKAQNIQNGSEPDGTSGILRVHQDGKPVTPGILGNTYPSDLYYSYGIWNSFGIAFDPITKILWDTQIGLPFGDEINLVNPGFNSGYNKIDGIWLHGYGNDQTEKYDIAPLHPNNLADFNGRGKYHPPQFTWFNKVVPTGITFMNSKKLGSQYENDMFVADDLNGNIYHFKLNSQRTGLMLPSGPLRDLVANRTDHLDQIKFGKGFGGITDLKVNPYDGYLYVLTFDQGTIYRIAPIDQ